METTGRFFGGPFLLLSIELEQEASPMAVSKRARLAAKRRNPERVLMQMFTWGSGGKDLVKSLGYLFANVESFDHLFDARDSTCAIQIEDHRPLMIGVMLGTSGAVNPVRSGLAANDVSFQGLPNQLIHGSPFHSWSNFCQTRITILYRISCFGVTEMHRAVKRVAPRIAVDSHVHRDH